MTSGGIGVGVFVGSSVGAGGIAEGVDVGDIWDVGDIVGV
jgi:hypothetical protein